MEARLEQLRAVYETLLAAPSVLPNEAREALRNLARYGVYTDSRGVRHSLTEGESRKFTAAREDDQNHASATTIDLAAALQWAIRYFDRDFRIFTRECRGSHLSHGLKVWHGSRCPLCDTHCMHASPAVLDHNCEHFLAEYVSNDMARRWHVYGVDAACWTSCDSCGEPTERDDADRNPRCVHCGGPAVLPDGGDLE